MYFYTKNLDKYAIFVKLKSSRQRWTGRENLIKKVLRNHCTKYKHLSMRGHKVLVEVNLY